MIIVHQLDKYYNYENENQLNNTKICAPKLKCRER